MLLEAPSFRTDEDPRPDLTGLCQGVEHAQDHRPAAGRGQRLAAHAGNPGDRIVRPAIGRQNDHRERLRRSVHHASSPFW